MSIRTKVFSIVIVLALVSMSILFFVLQNVFSRDFFEIEKNSMRQNLDRISFAIDNEEITINKLASAYAVWDETYKFVEDGNQQYIDNYFRGPTFINSEINVFAVVNNDGQIVKAENFDLQRRVEVSLSAETLKAISNDFLLSRTLEKGKIGILQTGEGPLLFGTYPILTSQGEGPVRGTVFMGRFLDPLLIEKLGTITKLPITFNLLADISTDSPQGSVPVLSPENPVSIKPIDSKTLAGYYLLSDVYGKPYVIAGTQTSRDINAQGKRAIFSLLLGFILVSGLITLIFILFLNRTVFSRIRILSKFAAGISMDGRFSSRLSLKGRDELSVLSNEMNAMITRLENINSRLLESENKYSTLVEKSSDGIILITNEKVTYANPGMLHILGLEEDELIGSNFLNFISPKYRETMSDRYNARLSGHSTEESYEIEIDGKNKRAIPVEVRSKLIKLNDQNRDMVIFRDITERKLMEAKILDLYEKEKSHRQELEEEARRKSLFIDILAHELRNPLSPIISSSELLQELSQNNSNEMQKRLISNIRKGTGKLARKLEELLDMARYSRGTFTLNRQPVEIKSYLEEIIVRFRPTIEKRNQKLVVDIAGDVPVIPVDASRLEQVLVNLLSNASKFSPESSKIYFKAFLTGNNLEIDVKDEGIGISPDDQKKLFEPYFRVQNDRLKVSGMGLGLTVCQKIIEAHGGTIRVASQPGQGSTFSFRIPLM